jgi:cytochrome c oxidase subunit 4
MAHAKHVSGVAYVLTFVGLLALATLSLLLSFLHWPTGDLVVSLVIAFVKMVLVLFFFMHLVEEPFSSRVVVLGSLMFVTLLVLLTTIDVHSRHTFPAGARPSPTQAFYAR